jgi:hypothetical protein
VPFAATLSGHGEQRPQREVCRSCQAIATPFGSSCDNALCGASVNALGWFIDRPAMLPPLPGIEATGQAELVEIEYCARFPWAGGKHPWLDAVVITASHLIGVESKRFEPFRDTKATRFSVAYDRPVWGSRMPRYGAVRDACVIAISMQPSS